MPPARDFGRTPAARASDTDGSRSATARPVRPRSKAITGNTASSHSHAGSANW